MPKIKTGSIIKYIIGKNEQSFKDLEKIVLETDNVDELKDNCLLINEELDAAKKPKI